MSTPHDTKPNSAAKSVLSSDLRIHGDISSDGAVEILGKVEGTVTAKALSVGVDGHLNGTVSAESVEVKGKLDGRISCANLTLRGHAKVTADATYHTLVIESGAEVQGRFTFDKS
ncbi:bactofilin family protein [Falsirhodobacter halotolerans]|uniref:bactofilin family protein n=1 Tax=Falsirhodobacter halotolerans TaxID=1146892 RepID=UPI001FD48888|nr:polymer-forming cytoskeletal protein [Falsirhodobacter halotolerans]MCJ8140139.1 polymer-forming cytoskeletal protein [Falsirhodobacter halotolerans]